MLRVFGSDMALVDSVVLPSPPVTNSDDPPDAFRWVFPSGARIGVNVPFYPRAQFVVDRQGWVWSIPEGDPSYRITGTTLVGDTMVIFETQRAPVIIPSVVRDSAISAIRDRLALYGVPDQDWSKVPEVMPAIQKVFTAFDGDVWVQVPAGLARFDVYDRSGQHLRTVDSSLRVLARVTPVVRADRFWAVVTDELDVQYVVRARVVRKPG